MEGCTRTIAPAGCEGDSSRLAHWPEAYRILREYGAKDIYLFGSSLWKPRPHDIDLLISGVDSAQSLDLMLALECCCHLPVDLVPMGSAPTQLVDFVLKFGVPMNSSVPPLRLYTIEQLHAEVALLLPRMKVWSHNPVKVWEAFYEVLEFFRKKVSWENPEPDRHSFGMLLLFQALNLWSERQISFLHRLREARNAKMYSRAPETDWKQEDVPAMHTAIVESLLCWAEAHIKAGSWPPMAPASVEQPLTRAREELREVELEVKENKEALRRIRRERRAIQRERRAIRRERRAIQRERQREKEARERAEIRLAESQRSIQELTERLSQMTVKIDAAAQDDTKPNTPAAEEEKPAEPSQKKSGKRRRRRKKKNSEAPRPDAIVSICLELMPRLNPILNERRDVALFLLDLAHIDFLRLKMRLSKAVRALKKADGDGSHLKAFEYLEDPLIQLSVPRSVRKFIVDNEAVLLEYLEEILMGRSEFAARQRESKSPGAIPRIGVCCSTYHLKLLFVFCHWTLICRLNKRPV